MHLQQKTRKTHWNIDSKRQRVSYKRYKHNFWIQAGKIKFISFFRIISNLRFVVCYPPFICHKCPHCPEGELFERPPSGFQKLKTYFRGQWFFGLSTKPRGSSINAKTGAADAFHASGSKSSSIMSWQRHFRITRAVFLFEAYAEAVCSNDSC